ncbi:hypothetical protein OQA88_4282 [Cercophora sp. LCS_1]
MLNKSGAALLILASTAALTAARDSYGDEEQGPYGVTLARYNQLITSKPSQSTTSDDSWPDVTLPNSEAANTKWATEITVVGDIPFSELNSTEAERSWGLCIVEFRMDQENYPRAFRTAARQCNGALSEDCSAAIRKATIGITKELGENSYSCSCPDLKKLDACTPQEVESLGKNCIPRLVSAKDMEDAPDGKLTLVQYGSPAHEPGNQTTYEDFGSRSFPFVFSWGVSALGNVPQETNTSAVVTTSSGVTTIQCIRAKEIEFNPDRKNATDTGNESNAGSRMMDVSVIASVASLVLVWALVW